VVQIMGPVQDDRKPSYTLYTRNPLRIFRSVQAINRSPDSVVGIATSYGLRDRVDGVRVPVGSRIFSSARRPDQL
jgi:hypothetical protein